MGVQRVFNFSLKLEIHPPPLPPIGGGCILPFSFGGLPPFPLPSRPASPLRGSPRPPSPPPLVPYLPFFPPPFSSFFSFWPFPPPARLVVSSFFVCSRLVCLFPFFGVFFGPPPPARWGFFFSPRSLPPPPLCPLSRSSLLGAWVFFPSAPPPPPPSPPSRPVILSRFGNVEDGLARFDQSQLPPGHFLNVFRTGQSLKFKLQLFVAKLNGRDFPLYPEPAPSAKRLWSGSCVHKGSR